MKYTRKQIITTTVFDDNISDMEVIVDLFNTFVKSSVDVSIEYRDEKTKNIKFNEKVRIKSVGEKTIDILIFQKSFNLSVRNIPFEDVISIKLVTEKQNIIAGDDKLSKFDFIDIQETK